MSVTAASGFRAAGVAAGIKSSGALDLALVVNDGPATAAAGVFTRNQVKAAPVLWSQQVLTSQRLRAIVLNSGGANACTGPGGFQDTHATADQVAMALDCGAAEVAVCSTGLIGERLPLDALLSGIDKAATALADTPEAGLAAATAVLTTDNVPKQAEVSASGWTVGGFAKGAGMVAPSLATMLCVLTTDAAVSGPALNAVLRRATNETFERLDIDGTCSTNDTVLLMSSAASGIVPDEDEFAAGVQQVCHRLVRGLQADAEGVTKEIAITVRGAASNAEALAAARAVARDNLVKTAFFGSDPNWGRIAAAVGASPATVHAETLDIHINGVLLCQGGAVAADRASADLSGRQIIVEIDLHLADGRASVLTTDLSHGYVEENSAYSS
ncbi:MAG: bifunctional glutamate N-acetyltransferase/amino-acid acetyltransferase ArgJ [Pseudonocardiales bacterium]|nr:bifunctional glutamate N-acetyltransferase/amino-acid acetyltransferase ArgJ [Pseudonocardiales bacterium]MBV9652107.1 bifunctional glutamate N-acetyltransferase/amino-acid acetyltransferase ArgJ [Pseudonocardiales bacterium]